MLLLKIVIASAALLLVGSRVVRSLSPAQRTWLMGNLRYVVGFLGVVGVALVLWLGWRQFETPLTAPDLEAPSIRTVNAATRKYWLLVLGFWLAGHALVAVFAGKLGKVPAAWLHSVLLTATFFLFIIFPIIGFLSGAFSDDGAEARSGASSAPREMERRAETRATQNCVKEEPCTLRLLKTGVTRKVQIPDQKLVCFDSRILNSYKRPLWVSLWGNERECGTYPCAGNYDTFWFSSEGDVEIPTYWFVPIGTIQC